MRVAGLILSCLLLLVPSARAEGVRIAVFDVDATPPLGASMAYDPVKRLDELTLRCRGIAILGAGDPIVLCAVDWIGIANEGHDAFRDALAVAATTDRSKVVVHTLHQHDAPGCDFTAEKLVNELQLPGYNRFDGAFHREVMERAATALKNSLDFAKPVTHFGYGESIVREVASNRRVEVGEDGKVGRMRGSSCKIPELIALPEGAIDPYVSVLAFWNGDVPIAVISSYACHPQSYYRVGVPSPDFPGIARFLRGQDVNSALHVHFNGAGGNVAAGKYNDGSQPNRMLLANRLAAGMKQAFESIERKVINSTMIGWESKKIRLNPAEHLEEKDLLAKLKSVQPRGYISLADQLAWLQRVQSNHELEIACLRVDDTRMLSLPGELFVEYQLAAKEMRTDLHVMMAAYGDYGPGYIGTAKAYLEGGYEVAPTSSSVGPDAEPVIMGAMRELLGPQP